MQLPVVGRVQLSIADRVQLPLPFFYLSSEPSKRGKRDDGCVIWEFGIFRAKLVILEREKIRE